MSEQVHNETYVTTHFMVVVLLFGPVFFIYIHPASGSSMDQDRTVAIMYSVVSPVLNPLIYTLRNKQVKQAVSDIIKKTALFLHN